MMSEVNIFSSILYWNIVDNALHYKTVGVLEDVTFNHVGLKQWRREVMLVQARMWQRSINVAIAVACFVIQDP